MATYTIDNMPSSLSAGDIITCDYSGAIKSALFPIGTYELEAWGASGGAPSNSNRAEGGYSKGTITLDSPTTLYCVCGGKGSMVSSGTETGGYNGGGSATATTDYSNGSGGGATHIATQSGLLSSLSSYKSSILLASGGGGGKMNYSISSQSGYGVGGGNTATSGTRLTRNSPSYSNFIYATGGSQSSGGTAGSFYMQSETLSGTAGSFGKGGNSHSVSGEGGTGGGGGYYGGGGGVADWYLGFLTINALASTAAGGSSYSASSLSDTVKDSGYTTTNPGTYDGYIKITVVSVPFTNSIYVKKNNTWNEYSTLYKKISDSWVEQTKSSSVIDSSKRLVYGGNIS